jgi:hypothetical protein
MGEHAHTILVDISRGTRSLGRPGILLKQIIKQVVMMWTEFMISIKGTNLSS